MFDLGILGGGWAGLLSAYEYKKNFPDSNVIVFEACETDSLGGLLRSEIIDGFTFDIGGPHILFSRNKEILKEIVSFLGDNVRLIERKAYIFFNNKFIPYPFENGIYTLDPVKRADIGYGIISSMLNIAHNPEWKPSTFKDWIYGFFGKTMGSDYLEPYNRKIWKRDPEEMDSDWVFSPGRLPFPDLQDITKSISGIESVGYKEQSMFYYPKKGGIQSLYNSLLEVVKSLNVEIKASTKVDRAVKKGGKWLINDKYECRNIINTLPPRILSNILGSPKEISGIVQKFDYNRVIVVGVTLNKISPYQHAVYVPRSDIMFHRFTWMNNLTDDAPTGKSNLIAEITLPMNKKIDLEEITRLSIEGLKKMNIIQKESEVIFTRVWMNEFGYPIYSNGHNDLRQAYFNYLNQVGIFTVGRWGSWHYWNTDKVFEAVKKEISNLMKHIVEQNNSA